MVHLWGRLELLGLGWFFTKPGRSVPRLSVSLELACAEPGPWGW